MAERSTMFAACAIAAALSAGAVGGFGASLFRPASPTQGPRAELVMLTDNGELPAGDKVFCAPPGAVLTLNPHARLGETKQVFDCDNRAGEKPIKIQASSDAAIRGAASGQVETTTSLTVVGQAMGFIRVPGHWQEF